MATQPVKIAPGDIESRSFEIIAQELGPHDFSPEHFAIVQRVIHATGDFSFAKSMRFSSDAVTRAVAGLRAGKSILTDVTMVASGISKPLLAGFGAKTICRVADPEIADQAKKRGKTRSETAIAMSLQENVGIVAIGNAPTALIETLSLIETMEDDLRPLVIGVPVGFVNAAESKQMLVEANPSYITSLGRKGGSPVAAAIVNALLRIAKAKED